MKFPVKKRVLQGEIWFLHPLLRMWFVFPPPQSSFDVRCLDPYMAFSGVYFCVFLEGRKNIWLGPFSDDAKKGMRSCWWWRHSDPWFFSSSEWWWKNGRRDSQEVYNYQLLLVVTWFSICIIYLGGGNSKIFGFFIPKIGEMIPNLTSIFFSKGLKPPTSYVYYIISLMYVFEMLC